MRFVLTFVVFVACQAAAAQTVPPGEGFEWEVLGDPPLDTYFLTVAPDGAYWGSGGTLEYPQAIYYYDEIHNVWADTTSKSNDADALAFLGPDTLLIAYNLDVQRSLDGGQTWEETSRAGGEYLLHIAPLGLPLSGGRIFVDLPGTDGLAYSTDRGRRFRPATYDPALFGTDVIRVWTTLVLTAGPHAGRVLQGGIDGIAYSDDGGESFRPSALWEIYRYGCGEIIEAEGQDGQHRLFAVVGDATQPYYRVSHSDDGGETWSELVPLPEVQDGIGNRGELVWLGPVGQPRSTLAVLPRGYIYRTDDGGETWALIGRAPVARSSEVVWEALIDPEGRLVVAAPHNAGTIVNGVFRTANPLPVVAAPEPPEASGVVLQHRAQPGLWRGAGAARAQPRQRPTSE